MRGLSLILFGVILLTGCGFQLRGSLPPSLQEKTIAITGLSSNAPLYQLFVAKLALGHGKLAKKPSEANVILHIIRQRHIRRPITLSQLGRANMFDLSFMIEFELLGQKALVLSPAREMAVHREYFNTQVSPLAQGLEEQQIRSEMETEAAATLLRQVATLIDHPPEAPSTREDADTGEDEESASTPKTPSKAGAEPLEGSAGSSAP